MHVLSFNIRHQRAIRIFRIGAVLFASMAVNGQAEDLDRTQFECLIEPKMTVMVGAPTQGVIASVDVERSDLVVEGQLLATLESGVETAALEHARMRATMKSEIEAREADLTLAQVNMRRINELFTKQMVPLQQRDEAIAKLEVAKSAVNQALDNRRLYEHEFARAKKIVEQHVIRSPISGIIVERRAFPGEFVYENPVVTVAQIDPLRVEAILPARYFGQIQTNMTATISPEIDHDSSLKVNITGVDRIIDTASGTFSVHLELPNPDHAIPGGQRCSLSFTATKTDEQLATLGFDRLN